MSEMMIGLLIGLAFAVAVDVYWGVFCARKNADWADTCEARDRAWQEQVATVVAWYYTRHRAMMEEGME